MVFSEWFIAFAIISAESWYLCAFAAFFSTKERQWLASLRIQPVATASLNSSTANVMEVKFQCRSIKGAS